MRLHSRLGQFLGFGFAALVAMPVPAAGALYGTSLTPQGVDLFIQIDPATGDVLRSTDVKGIDPWPFATDIAFAPDSGHVPEPGTLSLLASAVLAMLGLMRVQPAARDR